MQKDYYNTIYWVNIPGTKKDETFSSGSPSFDLSMLKEYNEKGYNIYQTVNTFIGSKRQAVDLAEIQSCFIDIDYPKLVWTWFSEEEKKMRASFLEKKFRIEVLPSIRNIKKCYDITPSTINVTHKGFHILYEYDTDCHFIDVDLHTEINTLLWDLLNGDKNARDVARVYKVVDYVDWKGGYKGKIKNLSFRKIKVIDWKEFIEVPKKITREIIQKKMNKVYKDRDIPKIYEAFLKRQWKDGRAQLNREKINDIDGKDFIDGLSRFFQDHQNRKTGAYDEGKLQIICNRLKYKNEGVWKYAMLEDDGNTPTSGLRLNENNGVFQIDDYSKKNRIGNSNFLTNWILSVLGLEKKKLGAERNKILASVFWIGWNSLPEKKTPINSKLLHDYFHERVRFPDESRKVFNTNNDLGKLPQIPSVAKVYFALFSYIHDKITKNNTISFDKIDRGYKIEYDDFFKFAFPWIDTPSKVKHHKKNLIPILQEFSKMEILFESLKNGTVEWKRIIDVQFPKISHHRGIKDYFFIKPLEEIHFSFWDKQAFFNRNILSYEETFGETKFTDFLLYAEAMIQENTHDFSIKTEYIFEFLWLTGVEKSKDNTLRKHLNNAISTKYGFFKSYSIQKGTVYISRFEKDFKKKKKVTTP
ncbi:MAG: hypothetical protein ACD_71C00179G0006 [uncultured bacterium (gcode 4)]|uniref:Uncharacterized protein n=1 Tax=uncultured bacterium (gcode 4) TaxID=1234023 RepID=K1Z4V1_9BACT|nr:MAG: hypothetical protein ACD_71C00179G0006 [uncultured bacterium (gcode 4)]